MSAAFDQAPVRFDDAPDAAASERDDLYDPGYWEREADKMQRAADYYAEAGRFGKAEYSRSFIASFRGRAAMLRRQA